MDNVVIKEVEIELKRLKMERDIAGSHGLMTDLDKKKIAFVDSLALEFTANEFEKDIENMAFEYFISDSDSSQRLSVYITYKYLKGKIAELKKLYNK